MKIADVKRLDLPKVLDDRGNLSFFQNMDQVPFDIKRTYWIYDVPGGEQRGGHAFRQQHEFIIALSGSFDVVVSDGAEEKTFSLNRSYYGVYIPNGIWRHIENFSTNSLALIVSDMEYDADDYIRDVNEYKKFAHG